jgi:eukaryotic-like serine/threonine-protein kinase
MRVSATGGTPSLLTKVDRSRNENLHVLPSFLPDGQHFLYFRFSETPGNAGTYVGSIDAEPGKQDSRQLLATVPALYAPSSDSSPGQLLFLRGGTLLAQPFDVTRLQLSGEPVPVAEQVGNFLGFGFFSLSSNGILAYRTRAQDFQLTWLDRQGNAISRVWEPGPYTSLAVSPELACVQCTRAASSHQLSRLRMVGPWGFACMNAFTESPDDQVVPVQNVFRRSHNSLTARFPSALAACRAIRNV